MHHVPRSRRPAGTALLFMAPVLVAAGLWLAVSRGWFELLSAGVLLTVVAVVGLGLGLLLAVSAFERVRRAGVRLDGGLSTVAGRLSGAVDEAQRATSAHGDELVRQLRRGAEHGESALTTGLDAVEARLDESLQRPET